MGMQLLDLHVVAVVFAVFVAVIAFVNRKSRKYCRARRSEAKKIYACGEDISPARMNVPQDAFYAVMIRSLRLEKLRQWHSGNLTRYLIWVFAGMVLMMIYLLQMWGM
jgi:hypothetical protein